MATKNGTKGKATEARKVEFKGFVNVYLTPQDKKQIKEHPIGEDEILGFIDDAAKSGYKVSTSYSTEGGFYSVTLYGNTPENLNAGWAMTLRHRDLLTAWTALAFSHEYKGVMGDWEGKDGGGGELDW